MNSWTGTWIWDLRAVSRAWSELALAAAAAQRLVLASEQRVFATEWQGLPGQPGVVIARREPAVVTLFGAARIRPDVPAQSSVAGYLAQTIADKRPLPPALAALDGEFAVVAWDAAADELFLAVDPMGHHALYYSLQPGGVLWSSHPQRIGRLLGQMHLNREALNLYLALKGIPAPWSIVAGVRKVRPGHVLRVTPEHSAEHEYWLPGQWDDPGYEGSFADARAALLDRLAVTVRRYVEDATPPVGLFLSGGLDSTVLLAIAQQAGVPLHAYSVGYTPAHAGDESVYARQAADRLGVPIEVYRFAARDAAEVVQTALPHTPEPVADATLLPQMALARHAAAGAQVILDGTGADGLLGGSAKYVARHYGNLYLRIPGPARRRLIAPLSHLLPASRRWKLTNLFRQWQFFIDGCEMPPEVREIFWTRFLPQPALDSLLTPEWRISGDIGTLCLRAGRRWLATDSVSAASVMTLKGIMPWVELLKLRSLEQQAAISVRKPFLSPWMIEFGLRLPDQFKVRGREGKVVLRAACDGLVPSVTLRRRKANFAPPIGRWLRHDLREIVEDTFAQDSGVFDMAHVRRMLWQDAVGWRDWQAHVWAMFVLQYWWMANQPSR